MTITYCKECLEKFNPIDDKTCHRMCMHEYEKLKNMKVHNKELWNAIQKIKK